MASKSFFVELQVTFNENGGKQKLKILENATARMAKGLGSLALLLSDRADPRVRMHTTDTNNLEKINLNKYDTSGPCPMCGHQEEHDGCSD